MRCKRFIDDALRNLDVCYAQIDGMLVASSYLEEHPNYYLMEANVFLVSFLGKPGLLAAKSYRSSHKVVKPITASQSRLRGCNQSETAQSIYGYCQFLQKLPTHSITQRDSSWLNKSKLTNQQNLRIYRSFQSFKRFIGTGNALHPKFDTPWAIFCDASDFAIGADYLPHPGTNATFKSITQRYFWLSIKIDCRNWMNVCNIYQLSKVTRTLFVATLAHHNLDSNIVMLSGKRQRYWLTVPMVNIHNKHINSINKGLH